jgi:hypothetical protein
MTPPDVLGLDDKNTGDAAGDDSFVLQRRTLLEHCLTNPGDPLCKTVLSNNTDPSVSTDVILELQIEVDGQWGPYLFCNPASTKDPQGQWNCTTSIPGGATPEPPSDFPGGACSAAYTGFQDFCFSGKNVPLIHPVKEFTDVDLAGCCAEAGKATSPFSKDGAVQWTYWRSNRTCFVFPDGTQDFSEDTDCVSGVLTKDYPPAPAPCECERVHKSVGREDLAATYGPSGKANFPAGGIWYSHPGAGRCTGTQTVGDGSGCSWRLVNTTSKVKAQCVYDAIDAAVVALDQKCFDKCPETPAGGLNSTSACYLRCYSTAVYAASQQTLVTPWKAAFNGGCPQAS